jgi:predicted TIM-barrel fold metal-dependent hydrolase
MIVDAWVQHPTGSFLRDPMFASLLRWRGMDVSQLPDELPVDFLVGALDAAKIDRALVSAWWGPSGPMLSNEHVARVVAAAPDRLVGVCSVDLARPMEAVRELRRSVKERGLRGLRMLPWLWNAPPDDRRYYPLYAECVELGVPFCLQVGHTGPLAPSEPGRPIPYLDRGRARFPRARDRRWPHRLPVDRRDDRARDASTRTSTSTPRPTRRARYPRELVEFMRGHGKKKVLFGSNFPMITPSECLADVDALGLSDDARALFLGGNAKRVFRL